jgi:hypothetical protein
VSVYHSPRCRITWTNVISDGVDRDVIVPSFPVSFLFGLDFDNALRGERGTFNFVFDLHETRYGNRILYWWSGQLSQIPGSGGSIWLSVSSPNLYQLFNGDAPSGPALYQPWAQFDLWGQRGPWDGLDEFAVPEEQHWIYLQT